MKNVWVIVLMLVLSIVLATKAAKAQSSVDVACRAKAKDVALQAFETCMSSERQTRAKEIRQNYQAEMDQVKSKYDKMLKELSGAPTGPAVANMAKTAPLAPSLKKKRPQPTPVPARVVRQPEAPTKGIARSLPPKRRNNGPAIPIRSNNPEEIAVVLPPEIQDPEMDADAVETAATSENSAPAPEMMTDNSSGDGDFN